MRKIWFPKGGGDGACQRRGSNQKIPLSKGGVIYQRECNKINLHNNQSVDGNYLENDSVS